MKIMALIPGISRLTWTGGRPHYRYISNMLVDSIFYGNNEAESALSDRPGARPRKLPWCETEEDHEAAMADLAAQDSRWS